MSSKKYYQVLDWDIDPFDEYFTDKDKALRCARKKYKDMRSFDAEGKVIVNEFEMADLPIRELNLNLLNRGNFMVNKREILVLKIEHEIEGDDSEF